MFITDKELGSLLSVSRYTVWRWARTKPNFPQPYNLSPGCTRWKIQEVEAWCDLAGLTVSGAQR
ncbi:MAG: helix-turn-helix transcriptional regulator [Mangrovicoccus sp.]